jgi:hypothetical protein
MPNLFARTIGPFARSGWALLVLVFLALAANLATVRPAQAALTACNKTSYVLVAAIGFDARERSVSRGWYQIEPGQCRALIEGKLEGRVYYTFAHSLTIYTDEVKRRISTLPGARIARSAVLPSAASSASIRAAMATGPQASPRRANIRWKRRASPACSGCFRIWDSPMRALTACGAARPTAP